MLYRTEDISESLVSIWLLLRLILEVYLTRRNFLCRLQELGVVIGDVKAVHVQVVSAAMLLLLLRVQILALRLMNEGDGLVCTHVEHVALVGGRI